LFVAFEREKKTSAKEAMPITIKMAAAVKDAAAAAAATLFRLRLLAESKHADGGNWPSSNLMTATTHQKIFFAVLETTLPPRRPTWRL